MAAEGSEVRRRGRTGATKKRMQADDIPDVVRQAQAKRPHDDRDTTVIVAPTRTRADEQYVLLFASNMLRVLLYAEKLHRTDVCVFLAYAEAAAWGNAVSISQRDIADRLSMHPSQVSRSVCRLREAGLLIRHGRSMYLNLTVLLRGRLSAAKSDYMDQMQESIAVMRGLYGKGITPPITLPAPDDEEG